MDIKQIKQIIDLMKRSDLSEFSLEEEGLKIKIKRGENGQPVITNGRAPSTPPFASTETAPPPIPAVTTPPVPQAATPPAPTPNSHVPTPAVEEAGITYIKSPMVGTFYRSSSPESAPFTDTGAKVETNTVVCIIEAMKIMNEIQAEAKGTILEALVESGQPVEYGQRLFKLKAA